MSEPNAPLIDLTRLGLAKVPGVEPYPPFERHLFTELFVECAVLQLAFEGESADIKGGLDKYLRFIEYPMGLSLACCAGETRTRGPVSWSAFCASLKLDGCSTATAQWTLRRCETGAKTALAGFTKSAVDGPLRAEEADYWNRQIRAEIGEGMEGLAHFAAAFERAKSAEKKRARRKEKKGGSERNDDPFRHVIERDWLIEALWCLSTKAILDRFPFMPQTAPENVAKSCKRIDRTISALGFADSRRPKHERTIARSVAELLSQLRKSP